MKKIGERAACRYCGQEIEWQGREHGWRDRGGNRQCVPFTDRKVGEIVKPKTKHAPYREEVVETTHITVAGTKVRVSEVAELALGITKQQIASMQRKVNQLERENDAIALTRIRHAIHERLVEIRLLLRDGHIRNKNRL